MNTGINKEWAQKKLTKKYKRNPIKIHKLPKDASIPQISDKNNDFKEENKKLKEQIVKLKIKNKKLNSITEIVIEMNKEFQRRLNKK